MNPQQITIAELLIDLECELRKLNLWQSERPSEEALNSDQPFCLDTLDFHQWLQFVFIEKIRFLLESGSNLPTSCAIAPMAEEFYRGMDVNAKTLIDLTHAIDKAISQS